MKYKYKKKTWKYTSREVHPFGNTMVLIKVSQDSIDPETSVFISKNAISAKD